MAEEQKLQYTQPLVFEGRRPDDGLIPNQQHFEPNRYSDPTHQHYNQNPTGYRLPRSLPPAASVQSPSSGVVYYGYREEPPKYEDRVKKNRHLVDKKKVTRYVQHFSSDEEPEASKSRSRTASQLSKIMAYVNLQRKLLLWLFAILLLIIIALVGIIIELK